MQLSTHIGDDTLITRALVLECFPYQPDGATIAQSYHKLVALVAYAHEHPELDDLAYLREFTIMRADDEWRALSYRDFRELMGDKRNNNRLVTYGSKTDCGHWSRSHGPRDLDRLMMELKTLREHLERTSA